MKQPWHFPYIDKKNKIVNNDFINMILKGNNKERYCL